MSAPLKFQGAAVPRCFCIYVNLHVHVLFCCNQPIKSKVDQIMLHIKVSSKDCHAGINVEKIIFEKYETNDP